jgi:hypothetical protein
MVESNLERKDTANCVRDLDLGWWPWSPFMRHGPKFAVQVACHARGAVEGGEV